MPRRYGIPPDPPRSPVRDPARREQSLEDRYVVPEDSPLLGLYAGADISYGKFVKTIHDQKLIYRGDWADPIRLR